MTNSEMTADRFSQEVMALTPSEEALRSIGFSNKDIESYQRDYYCPRVSSSGAKDPLLDFCENFQISRIAVAGLHFCKPARVDSALLKVGSDDDNPIVYSETHGRISIRRENEIQKTIATCATSSTGFLRALLCADRFMSSLPFHPEKRTTGNERFAVLEECVSLAGAGECRPFYRQILGLNEEGRIWKFLTRPISLLFAQKR